MDDSMRAVCSVLSERTSVATTMHTRYTGGANSHITSFNSHQAVHQAQSLAEARKLFRQVGCYFVDVAKIPRKDKREIN